LLLYSESVSSILNTRQVANTRLNLKIIWILFLVVVSFVLIDVTVSSLADIYRDFSITGAGMSLYLSITGVLVVGTYFILKMTADKIREEARDGTYENNIQKSVWAVYYIMVAIMAFVILQILFFSDYYTDLLSIAPSISYGLATCLLGLLAYRFFFWFMRNRSLVVLLYGLAAVSASIYVGLIAVIFYVEIFIHQPAVTTLKSAGSFPDIETGLDQLLISTLPQILTASTFLLFWAGTVAILHANIRRIGKVKFWILVTTPIIFFLGTLISLFPEIQEAVPKNDPNSIIIPIYITNFSQVIAIGLFAAAFVFMARAIPHHQISDYIYITCFGLALFSIGIIATISGAGYPPFGLPTVSLVGPFSFLLFAGLNHSAISTAEDSDLRRTIKVSANQQLKLLDSIGTAEIADRLEKKVLEVTKSNAENLRKESGIEPSLSLAEAKEYLNEVVSEVRNKKESSSDDTPNIT
jgi:hypothetical protein